MGKQGRKICDSASRPLFAVAHTMRNQFPISNFQFSNKDGGFTIVELLVSMGIFIVVIGMVVGIFIGAFRTQRSLTSLMAANDNASLALEQMAREIRTGTTFSIPEGNGEAKLKFQNANDVTIYYRLNRGVIEREAGGTVFPITGNNVKMSALQFYLFDNGPQWPPRITITLSVTPAAPSLQAIVTNLQTTVSGRNF